MLGIAPAIGRDFVRSFLNLQRADAGCDTAPITTARFFMPGDGYRAKDAKARRVEDVVRRAAALPGVACAGASNLIPLDGGGSISKVEIPGQQYESGREPRLFYAGVTAHYLQTLGAPVLRGRVFTDDGHLPALVDGRLAGARELGTLDPVGQRFRLTDDPSGAWFTVIGVVADVMIEGVGDCEVTPAACVTYP